MTVVNTRLWRDSNLFTYLGIALTIQKWHEYRSRNKVQFDYLLAERQIFRKLFYKSEPDLPTKVALVRSIIQCEEHWFDYRDSLHHSWKQMMTKKQVDAHCAYCQYRIWLFH